MRIRLELDGDDLRVEPQSSLGSEWACYQAALKVAGGRNVKAGDGWRQVAPVGRARQLVSTLGHLGFAVDLGPVLTRSFVRDEEGFASRLAKLEAVSGLPLYPFQRAGAEFLQGRDRAGLFDAPGVGKTCQALSALPDGAAALVVCPASLKAVWVREAARFRPDLDVTCLSGRGSFRWPEPGELVVTNYDVLPGEVTVPVPRRTVRSDGMPRAFDPAEVKTIDVPLVAVGTLATRVRLENSSQHSAFGYQLLSADGCLLSAESCRLIAESCSLPPGTTQIRITCGPQPIEAMSLTFSGALPNPPPRVHLIADEAQALMTYKAKRTKRFRLLSELVRGRGGACWLLTGTPMLGKPPELWGVLSAAGLELPAFGSFETFVKCFGGVKVEVALGRYAYEWGRPDETVPGRLRAVSLRRTRQEVLPDLPVKRVEVLVESELRKADAKVLDRVWEAIVDAGQDVATLPAFEGMSEARRVLASCKAPLLDAIVRAHEEEAEPLVVFSAHVEPMRLLGARPGWAALTGEVSQPKRDRAVELFQAGQLAGLACTIGAAGTGITLTRACRMVFLDRDWTPALNEQAEDRLVRIGQTRGVLVTVLALDHPLDRRVLEVCGIKQELFDASVGASSRYKATGDKRQIEHAPKPRRQAQSAIERWTDAALCKLSSFENEVGWNKIDGPFGRRLRSELDRGLTEAQWAAAARVCSKYWRQVGRPPVANGKEGSG